MECPYCERRCQLDENKSGFCGMYSLGDGRAIERFPHRYSSAIISHIEAVPFFHFQPGSRTLLLGGAGCNFDCHYCSNAYVARSDPDPLLVLHLPPERVVAFAKKTGCHNIAFAVNEPTVAMPTLLELASVAERHDLPVGVLTNGYTRPEVTETMGRAFRFVNVSLKSLSDEFYRRFIGVEGAEVVQRNVEVLRSLTHLEITTPLVQGLNDREIPDIVAFITSIDATIPWHVFRLLPEYKMAEFGRPLVEETNAALEEARRRVRYLYFGNFVGSNWVSTRCPGCETVVLERISMGGCGAKLVDHSIRDGRCASCGQTLPVGDPVAWNSKESA